MRRTNRLKLGVMLGIILSLVIIALPQSVAAEDHPGASALCTASPTAPIPVAPADLKPFLKLPFRQDDGKKSLSITNGWLMSEDEIAIAGPDPHRALDLELVNSPDHGYGMPVLAAADGRAYYTYQYFSDSYTDPQGKTHQVGLGAGLVVEVRHCNGYVTQYIHVSKVAEGIPYLKPEPSATPGDWVPVGLFQSNQTLWQTGVPVKAGEVIGWQGDTGVGLDWKDDFNLETGQVAPRDRQKFPAWDPPQLHFQVYGGRIDGAKQNILDPSDIYGQITLQTNPYQKKPGHFTVGSKTLWLGKNQQLEYADE